MEVKPREGWSARLVRAQRVTGEKVKRSRAPYRVTVPRPVKVQRWDREGCRMPNYRDGNNFFIGRSIVEKMEAAVRAAFNAGVTPSRIARQFRISKSDVRKALASDEKK
jgi:hypothetical protein